MQALVSAWAVSRQQKVMGKPKPVPNADGWQIYWVKRGNSSTAGDNYFISPRGNKLASLTAFYHWIFLALLNALFAVFNLSSLFCLKLSCGRICSTPVTNNTCR